MMSEESEAAAAAALDANGSAASLTGHDAQLQRLETEKCELIDKLKKAVGAGKAMKKQLDDARADKATLRAQSEAQQQQLEDKDGELMVAISRVEAFQLELEVQLDTANQTQQKDALTINELHDKLQKAAGKFAQEEARVLVFQEENNRLTNQVAAMLEDKQQQERETQELVKENHSLQSKVEDLMQQVHGARQQQEDTEQMYLEVASKLNQALRDNDELKKATQRTVAAGVRCNELETQMKALETELAASAGHWEQEKQQLTQQIKSLTVYNEKATAELAEVAEIREQLLVQVGIDLTYESIESLLDTKSKEIQMLTKQLAATEAPQEQAVREAVSAAVAEAQGLQSKLETLQMQYESLATEKYEQDKTMKELHEELERVAEEQSALLSAKDNELQRAREEKQAKTEQLTAQLDETQTRNQQLTDDFSSLKAKIEALVAALEIGKPPRSKAAIETSQSCWVEELESYLEYIQKQVSCTVKPDMMHLQSEAETLHERIHKYEEENKLLIAKLEECETALKARASELEQFVTKGQAGSVDADTTTSTRPAFDLERELEATKAQLHALEAEMAACKAENLRMIFEVAKTADGGSKLKQNHEELLKTHREKSSHLDTALAQLNSLESANQTLKSDVQRTSNKLQCYLEAFAMQKEDFESVIATLNSAVAKTVKENNKIKRELEDIKTENDVLEERISELYANADNKTEPDEWQEKDREVEELRSSLVQAKVDFLEQKHQLTALEKKLVDVSKSSGPTCTVNNASLDAERREFEAALIEMIAMEKKLQAAYEAKQGLESTLQERMEAKAELEGRLSIAEDKIAELEQQLEQKVALIATIEEQLRAAEEEREQLSEEFAKTKSKLERSRGKLEEKAIEFEAFKTTTNMLKDERSRLFNEIALLKDKIAKSEVQKAAMADSQELANEELEEQLNELADKIAELETEKQDLRARLEETVYRSEEDIHQLRERLYMLEEEKSGLDDENFKLERTVAQLESKLDSLEEQKTALEVANESGAQQLNLLEDRVAKATSEIATLSAEKISLTDLQQSLEQSVSALEKEKVKLEQTLEEITSKLREELEQVTGQVETLQTQLVQSRTEKNEVTAALSDLRERAEADKAEVATQLEAHVVENQTLENKITVLKHMAEKALQSLQANRDELSEAEARAALLTEERDAVKVLLQEKQCAYDELTAQRQELQQQVVNLRNDLESLQKKHVEESEAAEETIHALKEAETTLTESLEAAKRDLAEAESCVMVLVEARDAARKDLAAKDLKIEMINSQQGERDLAAQKLENELSTLRSKNVADAEATELMLRDLKESKTQAEETARHVKDSLAQAHDSLQMIQTQLAESESRVAALEKERDVTRTSLNEQESTHETLSALQEDLQQKVEVLETELKELRDASAAELAVAHDTIASLKAAEAEEAKTLASVRQELAEAEGCVMVLVEERDAAKKILSKRELTLEVLSSEHGELQLKSQSVTTELEALRHKRTAEAQATEEMIHVLKAEVKQTTDSYESVKTQLSEAESRVASLTADCDTVTKTLSNLEAEHNSLSTHKDELMERVESLEAEMKTLQCQHSAELESAEKMIRALKTSEAEVTESLGSVRQELSEAEARAESLTKAYDAAKITLSDKELIISNLTLEAQGLQERIELVESELQELHSQRATEAETAEETIRGLKASESQTAETLEVMRQKLSEMDARAVSAEEERAAADKALAEMESHRDAQSTEVGRLQERIQSLESELQELHSQRATEAETAEETIRGLKASESQTAETLEVMRQKLSDMDARAASAEEERAAADKALAEMESHRDAQSTEVGRLQERIQSLESELQELHSQRATEAETAEETICGLKASESQTAETLEVMRQKLSEMDARAVSAEEERAAADKALAEMESHRDAQSTEVGRLQERIQSLESELQELHSQRTTEAETAEETIRGLKASESQTAETLEVMRQKLSEMDARAVSAEEERAAADKALAEMESHRDAQSTEVGRLQERIQSLESELQELHSQRATEAETAEETIRGLKASESQTAETLEVMRQKLSEMDARAASAEEERAAADKALAEMESHRDVQSTEVGRLQERIQSLESELQELHSQRATEAETAEETIRGLKASESQTAETLEVMRQKLSEMDGRAASAEMELNVSKLAVDNKKMLVGELSRKNAVLVEESKAYEASVSHLESMLETETLKLSAGAQQIDILKGQIASLSESSIAALTEVSTLREQRATEEECYATGIAQKDEVISTLKSKLEEVMAAYKRLKGHLQELQDRLTQQTTTNGKLKTSYDALNAQHSVSMEGLEVLQLELATSREQERAMTQEVRQAIEKLTEAETQRDSLMEDVKKRVVAYDAELAQKQRQHDMALHEQKEMLLAAAATRDEAAKLKMSKLEKSVATLTETVEKKELELLSAADRVRQLEQEHTQAGNDREETDRKHEAERMELEAQLSSANENIEKLRLARDTSVSLQRESSSKLENLVAKLKLQVEAETEGANAARAALETYKKRAHTALKKASSENKLNLKKAVETTTKLEQELVAAKGRIRALETELDETRTRMAEVKTAGDVLEAEKRSQEAALRLEIDSLKADVTRLQDVLENDRVPLEDQIQQLRERNEALSHEIVSLKEEVQTQTESMKQAVQTKEEQINDLSKQLQAALAAAASLATNEAERRSYSPASSPTDKERRSTASSSRSFDSEGNNSFLHQVSTEEQHEHIAAAVADSCPIPLVPTNGLDQHSKPLADEDEVVRLKFQLNELETKSHLFQEKYKDTFMLLEEANRQKQHLQELDEYSTQAINIEYLKNVIMKYIESQVASEKEQLVPVIATLLDFSPHEQQKVMAAHRPNDEGAGLFGGVFSLFGGGAAAAPPPKALAARHNLKPSPTSTKSNRAGAALGSKDKKGVLSFGSDPSDDEEFATPLNPFAA